MAALVLLLFLLALGAASLTGRTADSRDRDYALGQVIGGALVRSGRPGRRSVLRPINAAVRPADADSLRVLMHQMAEYERTST